MKLRSGGLLFREKGSMDDFRGPGDGYQVNKTCSWAPWASFWEAFAVNNRLKLDLTFDMNSDMFVDRFLIENASQNGAPRSPGACHSDRVGPPRAPKIANGPLFSKK